MLAGARQDGVKTDSRPFSNFFLSFSLSRNCTYSHDGKWACRVLPADGSRQTPTLLLRLLLPREIEYMSQRDYRDRSTFYRDPESRSKNRPALL